MGADMAAGNCCCNSICRISLDDWDGNGLHTFESVSNLNTTIPSAPTGVTTLTKTDAITGTITGATNASPIVITSAGHGLSTGDQVSITGVVGNTAANGVRAIISLSSSTFSLTGSTGSGAYISGGTWKAYDGTTLDKVKYPDTSFSGATPIVDNQSNSLEVNTSFNWTQGVSTFQNAYYCYGQTYQSLVLYPTGQKYNYWMEIDFAVRYLNKTHDTSSTPTTVTDYTYNVGDAFTGMQNVIMCLAIRQGSNVWIQPFPNTYREGVTGFVWNSGGTYSASLKSGKWVRKGSNAINPLAVIGGSNDYSTPEYYFLSDLTNTGTLPLIDLCYGAAPIYFGWATVLKGIQHTSGGTYRSDRLIEQKIRIDRMCLNWIEDPAPACPCFDNCFKFSSSSGERTYSCTSTTADDLSVKLGPAYLSETPPQTYTVGFTVYQKVVVDDISWLTGGSSTLATPIVMSSTNLQDYLGATHSWTSAPNPPPVVYLDNTHFYFSTGYTPSPYNNIGTIVPAGATISSTKTPWTLPTLTDCMLQHGSWPAVSPFTTWGSVPTPWCVFNDATNSYYLGVQKSSKHALLLLNAGRDYCVYACDDFDTTGGSFTLICLNMTNLGSGGFHDTSNWPTVADAITLAASSPDPYGLIHDTLPTNITVTGIRCDGTTIPGGETGAGSCEGGGHYTSSFISGTWRWINSSAGCSTGCVAPAALTSSFISSYGNPTGSGQTLITDCVPYINHAPQGANKTISGAASNYTFAAADFSFTDPNDWPQANFLAVKVAQLPTIGTLTLDVVHGGTTTTTNVVLNQYILKSDIDASRFKYVVGPSHYATAGVANDVWKFQVQDDGGTDHDGLDTDATKRNFTFGIRLNHAPVGTDKTIAIGHNTPYTFSISDFGFTDPNDSPPDLFYEFHIISVPTHGVLAWSGSTMHNGDAQLTTGVGLGNLVYTPTTGYSGTDTITFKVQDDGGTLNSGVDTDTSARTWTLNVS